ncbi:hypothetical protein EDD27_7168 [Nonomuraea polychroma]|uniref:Uncharacterized protein n=1 Tax=Nonomuraea polychroma TaxID=46176 RepID=A0A438MG27_9ACTN|nr:hypothetical protein [Nonomuraea polychroma]RVX44435.1 hypothetical protein EDD27_7168 [Nonomuraea polychroma]
MAEVPMLVEQYPVTKELWADQIRPLPCPAADGSCSTSTATAIPRHSGSETLAENAGVSDERVHNPDANCPDDDTPPTVGLLVSTLPACHSDQGPATEDAELPASPRIRHRINHPSCSLPEGMAEVPMLVEQYPVTKELWADQIRPLPCPAADGSCSTSTATAIPRHSGSETLAENAGVSDEKVHNPDANCPDDDTPPTVGLLVSTLPACHSDQGPATEDAELPASPRIRHRINHPSCSLPEGITGLSIVVSHHPVTKSL